MIKHYRVTGRVQGVFFRGSTQVVARKLGLAGWVRNCEDGSVEALASGEQAALQNFERWLANGPEMAKVSDVNVQLLVPSDADFARLVEKLSRDFDIL
ncbi:acylphosphatase [Alteromonadaceae bacterium Bs31]|nr:acylphosphatase [Alteromonadaceae bacterium Bs31]